MDVVTTQSSGYAAGHCYAGEQVLVAAAAIAFRRIIIVIDNES